MMGLPRSSVGFALAVAVLACGPSARTDAGESTTTSADATTGSSADGASGSATTTPTDATAGSGTTGGPPDACTCISVAPGDAPSCEDVTPFACDLPDICGHVGYWCPRPNRDFYACAIEYDYDEVVLDCALAALRDRTPGVFTAGGENDICGFEGCGDDAYRIAIAGDEVALVQSCNSNPIDLEYWSTESTSLAPAAFFQDCLDLAAASARYGCLFEGLQQRVAVCE